MGGGGGGKGKGRRGKGGTGGRERGKTRYACLHEGQTEQHKQDQPHADSLHVCRVDLPLDMPHHSPLLSTLQLFSRLLHALGRQVCLW